MQTHCIYQREGICYWDNQICVHIFRLYLDVLGETAGNVNINVKGQSCAISISTRSKSIAPHPTCSHIHINVIKWKQFPRYWRYVRGIHRSPVNSPHKDQWRGALMFSLVCPWINDWLNNRNAGDLRRHRAHYDIIAMNHGDYRAGSITSSPRKPG